jgi:hypothetical protein
MLAIASGPLGDGSDDPKGSSASCTVIMDDGFCDYVDGVCPAGHRQVIDD